jgi:hypothetical protein
VLWDGVPRVMRRLFCLPAALLVVLVAANSTGAGVERGSVEFDRVCATHAEGAEPDDVALPDPRTDVVAGRVSIASARSAARLLPRRKPTFNPRAWILKTPVIIRAGSPVVVRVAERDRRFVAFDFDVKDGGERDRVAEDGQSSVRFHACPPDTKRFSDGKPLGEWTGYPGGLIVERRRCVTFEFLEEGKPTVRRRLGIGLHCRG